MLLFCCDCEVEYFVDGVPVFPSFWEKDEFLVATVILARLGHERAAMEDVADGAQLTGFKLADTEPERVVCRAWTRK